MADEAQNAEEFERGVLHEQVGAPKKYVARELTSGHGRRLHGRREDGHRRRTVRNEFRKRTGMSFREFFEM